jgi:hypothetical protein
MDWTGLGSSPGLRSERLAANRLSYSTAVKRERESRKDGGSKKFTALKFPGIARSSFW